MTQTYSPYTATDITSLSPSRTQTHPYTATDNTSLSPSRTQTHPYTATDNTSLSLTPPSTQTENTSPSQSRNTATLSLIPNMCANIKCVTAQLLPLTSTFISSSTSPTSLLNSTTTQCSTNVAVPFASTQDNSEAIIRVWYNISYPESEGVNITSVISTSSRVVVSIASIDPQNMTLDVKIRRVDSDPVGIVSTTLSFYPVQQCDVLPLSVPIQLGAPPSRMSRDEELAVSVVSAVGGTGLQAVVGLGLLRCTPGDLRNDDLNIRGLVPVALSNSCEGAVQGALLTIAVVAILNTLGMVFIRHRRNKMMMTSERKTIEVEPVLPSSDDDADVPAPPLQKSMGGGCSWWEAASMAFCPSITLAVASLLQMGLIVCGGRILQDGSSTILGIVGVLVGLILFPLFPFLVWLLVSRRCYQLSTNPEAPAKLALYWLLPSYMLDSEIHPTKAFSTLVSQRRLPHFIWATLPILQPTIMFFPTMAAPGYCSGLLIFAAVLFAIIGVVILLARPYFIPVQNMTRGLSLLITAMIVGLSARLAMRPGDGTVASIVALLAMAQTAVSVVQIIHVGLYQVVMKVKGDVWFKVTSPSRHQKSATPAPPTTIPLLVSEDAQNADHPPQQQRSLPPIPVFNVVGYLLKPKRRTVRSSHSNGSSSVSDAQHQNNINDSFPLVECNPSDGVDDFTSLFNNNNSNNNALRKAYSTSTLHQRQNTSITSDDATPAAPHSATTNTEEDNATAADDDEYDDCDDDLLLDHVQADMDCRSKRKRGDTFADMWGTNYKGHNPMVLPYDREDYSSGSGSPDDNDLEVVEENVRNDDSADINLDERWHPPAAPRPVSTNTMVDLNIL